jgi:hypothetical protein
MTQSAPTPAARATPRSAGDDGRAIIEVIFLAVLVLIPIVYIMATLLRLQSATLAVAQAARDAGRLIETADDPAVAMDSASRAARVALADQHVPSDGLRLRFVAPGGDCRTGVPIEASLQAGATYDVCVIAVISLPGIPTVLTGSSNTVAGAYTVHIGDLREGP